MDSAKKLEREADDILRAAGSGSLCINWDYDWQHLEFSKNGHGGIVAPHYIYEPVKDVSGIKKSVGPPCPSCGKPMSKWAHKNSKCRACFHAKALKKHSERVVYKEKRQEIVAEKHMAAAVFLGKEIGIESVDSDKAKAFEWTNLYGDFSPELIEEISAAENAVGIPAAFWGADISLLRLAPLVYEF